jgi:hypothetical protein
MNKNVGKAPVGAEGVITRGKTARNRLRRVDIFMLLYARELLNRRFPPDQASFVVDLGYGEEAITVIEMASRLRRLNPQLPILGVEIDPARVAKGSPHLDAYTKFRLGGFNLPLQPGESARIIRAFNVLRQYNESEVFPAWFTMAQSLIPDGLLIEGTSDPFGTIWTANILRKKQERLVYEGLLFNTNFHSGFTPELFQPVLPKNFIHRMIPGEPIHSFIEKWKSACQASIAYKQWGLRQWFQQSARILAAEGFPILLSDRLLKKGYLLWHWNQEIPKGTISL